MHVCQYGALCEGFTVLHQEAGIYKWVRQAHGHGEDVLSAKDPGLPRDKLRMDDCSRWKEHLGCEVSPWSIFEQRHRDNALYCMCIGLHQTSNLRLSFRAAIMPAMPLPTTMTLLMQRSSWPPSQA